MRHPVVALAMAFGFFACGSFAAVADQQAFTAETWRAKVAGRTLSYRTTSDGTTVGREYFSKDGDRTVWRGVDGSCREGRWSEANGVFCYHYRPSHCLHQFERDGITYVRDSSGEEQIVVDVSDDVLSCPKRDMRATPDCSIFSPDTQYFSDIIEASAQMDNYIISLSEDLYGNVTELFYYEQRKSSTAPRLSFASTLVSRMGTALVIGETATISIEIDDEVAGIFRTALLAGNDEDDGLEADSPGLESAGSGSLSEGPAAEELKAQVEPYAFDAVPHLIERLASGSRLRIVIRRDSDRRLIFEGQTPLSDFAAAIGWGQAAMALKEVDYERATEGMSAGERGSFLWACI